MNKASKSFSTNFYSHHNNTGFITLQPLKSEQIKRDINSVKQKLFSNISQFPSHQYTLKQQQQPLKRNKSLSQSKSSLFSKAHSINRHQSFINRRNVSGKSNINDFKLQLKLLKTNKQQQKVSKQMQRRLIIKKVLTDMQSQKPKLTLRGEIEKLNQNINGKHQKQINPQSSLINNCDLTYSELNSPLKSNNKATHHKINNNQNEQLSFSFVTIPNQNLTIEPHFNKIDQHHNIKMNNISQFYNDSLLSKNQFTQYAKQLSQTIQASIKKQFQEIYKQKQKLMQIKYNQKEQQYLQKINKTFQQQFQKQRKSLLQKIGDQVQGKLSRLKLQPQSIQSQVQKIQRKEELPMRKVENKIQKASDVPIDKKKLKSIEKKDNYKDVINQSIEEIKMVQKQKSIKSVASAENNKYKIIQNKPNQYKNIKNQDNTIFKNVDNSMIDQIDQIRLNSTRKEILSPKNQNHFQKQKNNKINKTFDNGKQLNDSFEKKIDSNRQIDKQTQKSDSSLIPKSLKRKESQQDIQKKKQRDAERAQVKKTLLELNKNDAYLTFIGQVFAYCSKFNKKSRVQWRVPSLFLYRYCYDSYRNFTSIYQRGVKMGLIKPEDYQKFQKDNNIIKQNLQKLYKIVLKKVQLTAVYKQIITSPEIELKRLYKVVKIEVKKYASRLKESDQVSNGDENVARCGLRMMYSWLIILWLQGRGRQIQNIKIDEMVSNQLFRLFDKTLRQIQQSQ